MTERSGSTCECDPERWSARVGYGLTRRRQRRSSCSEACSRGDLSSTERWDTAPEGDRFLAIVPASVTEDAAEARDYTMVLDWFAELRARVPVP